MAKKRAVVISFGAEAWNPERNNFEACLTKVKREKSEVEISEELLDISAVRPSQWRGCEKGKGKGKGGGKSEVAKLKRRETKESIKHNTSLQKGANYLIRLQQKWRFIR